MIVHVNKSTFEVISHQRFQQLAFDAFYNSDEAKRLRDFEAELEEVWPKVEVQEAEVRATCPYTRCIYHLGGGASGGCGAPVSPMKKCYKENADKFMEGVHP